MEASFDLEIDISLSLSLSLSNTELQCHARGAILDVWKHKLIAIIRKRPRKEPDTES